MDKVTTPAPPAVPKRQSSLRNGLRLSPKPDASSVDGSSASALAHDVSMASSSGDNRSPERDATTYSLITPLASPTSQLNGITKSGISNTVEPTVMIDRSVESRTQFQITLPLSVGVISSSGGGSNDADPQPIDQRGWSSPHGEPYRPLGKPDLNLKFSPRLANGVNLLQNAHRMKVFEGKDVKEKGGGEVRHAHAVTHRTSESGAPDSASRSPGLFELFPLNFTNKKRPLDERQVKLAHRLHASTSHYSPERVHGLQCHSPHQQPREQQLLLLSTRDTDQKRLVSELHSLSSSQGADASVDLLRKVIHECSSRLRSVKNGAGFLTQVPSSEHLDLLVLQEKYHRERAQFASSSTSTSSSLHEPLHHSGRSGSATVKTSTRGPYKASLPHYSEENPFDDKWDTDAFSNTFATASASDLDSDDLYLPYTSRQLQKSPNKRHPTLSEFKSRVREEKMPRPLLSMQSTGGAGATEGLGSPTAGGAMTRSSIRVGGSILLSGHRSLDRTTDNSSSSPVGTPAPPSPPRASIVLGASSQISESMVATELSSLSMGTPRRSKTRPPQKKKLHSVERLQAAVDALQDTKRTHSEKLAKTVESLSQDRRDCLAVKFRHFHVQHHLDDDIRAMRHASETHRAEIIDDSVEKSGWYQDLLRQLLTREAVPLHPAESFFVRAIRRIANEGHVFEKEFFFRLILLLHRDDLLVMEVQQMLTFLRQALQVSLEQWEEHFAANGLPEPAEIHERKELRQEKRQHRLSKLRAVSTVNQAIRHFSRSSEQSR